MTVTIPTVRRYARGFVPDKLFQASLTFVIMVSRLHMKKWGTLVLLSYPQIFN